MASQQQQQGNMHVPAAHTDVRHKRSCRSIVCVTDVVERDGSKQQTQIMLKLAYHMPDLSGLLCSVPLRHHSVWHTVPTSATVIRVCTVYPISALLRYAIKLTARQATSRIGSLMHRTVQSEGDISLTYSYRPSHALLHFMLLHSSADLHSKIPMNL